MKMSLTVQQIKSLSPVLHAWLYLHLLVSREHNTNMYIPGVRFFLPQEVVDPGLDVGAEPGGLQLLGGVLVVLPVGPRGLVAGVTLEPGNIEP